VYTGIAVDYPHNDNHQHTVGWTLSPSESEHGANGRRESVTTTTFEIVDNNMKKNTTSSTLNSLGKSSSKLTAATSTNSSKFSQSNNGTSNNNNNNSNSNSNNGASSVSNITTRIVPLSVLQSEANYLSTIERLGCTSTDNHEHLVVLAQKAEERRLEKEEREEAAREQQEARAHLRATTNPAFKKEGANNTSSRDV
jgi:hypothetical protein